MLKRRYRRRLVLLGAVLALGLLLQSCAGEKREETPMTPSPGPMETEETAAATPSLGPTDAPDGERAPVPSPKRGERVRVAITLTMSADAGEEALRQEQSRVILAIEDATGEPLEVAWQFTKNVNVISADVWEGDIPVIQGIDGVAKVTRETLNELTVPSAKADI